jgi:hypothetical protein
MKVFAALVLIIFTTGALSWPQPSLAFAHSVSSL